MDESQDARMGQSCCCINGLRGLILLVDPKLSDSCMHACLDRIFKASQDQERSLCFVECVFCRYNIEDRDHLFFYGFSSRVWKHAMGLCNVMNAPQGEIILLIWRCKVGS
jgi:hypothetical protein